MANSDPGWRCAPAGPVPNQVNRRKNGDAPVTRRVQTSAATSSLSYALGGNMKRTLTLLGVSMLLLAAVAFAQKPMDDANEKAVHITSGPNITNITPTAATINWTTNSAGANHVRYRIAGSNDAWKSAYHQGGGTSHSLQMTGLQPGKTYEWQILTRDGDLRTAGQFATPTSGTAPDVNASASTPASAPPTTGAGTTVAKTPLYRGVSGNNHIFSTNAGDVSANGARSEGIAGYVASSQVEGTQPLYRLSNTKVA